MSRTSIFESEFLSDSTKQVILEVQSDVDNVVDEQLQAFEQRLRKNLAKLEKGEYVQQFDKEAAYIEKKLIKDLEKTDEALASVSKQIVTINKKIADGAGAFDGLKAATEDLNKKAKSLEKELTDFKTNLKNLGSGAVSAILGSAVNTIIG